MTLASTLLTAVQTIFSTGSPAEPVVDNEQKPDTLELEGMCSQPALIPQRAAQQQPLATSSAATAVRPSRKRARAEDAVVEPEAATPYRSRLRSSGRSRSLPSSSSSSSSSSSFPLSESSQTVQVEASPDRWRSPAKRARSNAVVAEPLSDADMLETLQARMGRLYDFAAEAASLQVAAVAPSSSAACQQPDCLRLTHSLSPAGLCFNPPRPVRACTGYRSRRSKLCVAGS